jgi:hypothetical protein
VKPGVESSLHSNPSASVERRLSLLKISSEPLPSSNSGGGQKLTRQILSENSAREVATKLYAKPGNLGADFGRTT